MPASILRWRTRIAASNESSTTHGKQRVMSIEAPTGRRFSTSIQLAAAADASVIWLKGAESSEMWFCNVQHKFTHGFCQTTDPFVAMPHCVLGIIQDAWNGTRKRDCGCTLHVKNPYYMELEVCVKLSEKSCVWLFPLTPENPSAIQAREKIQALAA